jgi:hypothetical protein
VRGVNKRRRVKLSKFLRRVRNAERWDFRHSLSLVSQMKGLMFHFLSLVYVCGFASKITFEQINFWLLSHETYPI